MAQTIVGMTLKHRAAAAEAAMIVVGVTALQLGGRCYDSCLQSSANSMARICGMRSSNCGAARQPVPEVFCCCGQVVQGHYRPP